MDIWHLLAAPRLLIFFLFVLHYCRYCCRADAVIHRELRAKQAL
jgi:hypothetical protein